MPLGLSARKASRDMGFRPRLGQAIRRAHHTGIRALLTPVLKSEWETAPPPEINEGAVQYPFALRALTDRAAHHVLDVGTGTTAWPQLLVGCGFNVTAIDEVAGYWGPNGFFNRHFYVQQADIRKPTLSARFDAVTCLNVMSTLSDDHAALGGMLTVLRPGGHIVLTFPYSETQSVADVYEHPGAGYGQGARYRCRVYSRADLDAWLDTLRVELVEQEYYRMFRGELWTMGGRDLPRPVSVTDHHHFTAVVLRRA
jgi:SAM-dependent methyltransferase